MSLLNLLVLSVITISSRVVLASKDQCLALVLKGGANRGSYEAGVIEAFVENLPPEEVQYDVVTGISVGALNAAHCSTYPKGEEVRMAKDLIGLWTNLTEADLYRSWPRGGIIAGLFW